MKHERPQQGATVEWYTPVAIVSCLGQFDLDPCANRMWPLAKECWHKGGFGRQWKGRVWLNPPYGKETGQWMEKLADHGNGIALVFARTDTQWFHRFVWYCATALFFFEGRIRFVNRYGVEEAAAPAPSVLVAYGKHNAEALANSDLDGKYLEIK